MTHSRIKCQILYTNINCIQQKFTSTDKIEDLKQSEHTEINISST